MKAIKFITAALFFSLVSMAGFGQTSNRKIAAILIGNHAYTSPSFPPLNFPVNDIEKMQTLCKELKFDTCITTFEKKTQKEFFDFLNLYKQVVLKPRHITDLVIYYSGHGGIQAGGESFLIPTDFDPSRFISIYESYKLSNDAMVDNDTRDYLGSLKTKTDCTPYETAFKNRLSNYNLIHDAVSVAMLCDSLKEFNLLIISDACRTPLAPSSDKGAMNLAGEQNDDLDQIGTWLEQNRHKSSGRAEKIDGELKTLDNYVSHTINDFNTKCGVFHQTISDASVRKPVTLLYGTNFYNTSTELSSIFSGAFTKCFIQCIKDSKSSAILIDDNFVKTVGDYINTTQKPTIEGVRNFGFVNPYIGSLPVNAANIQKTIANRSFTATRMILIKPNESPVDILKAHMSVAKKMDQKAVKALPDFSTFFNNDTTLSKQDDLKVEAKMRVTDLLLSFEDSKTSLYLGEHYTYFGGSDYSFNKDNQTFSLNNTSLNSNAMTKKTENWPVNGDYAIDNDSTISLKKTLFLPNIMNCDLVKIKRISINSDTVEMEIPDSYNQGEVMRIQMTALKNDRKIYAGSRIPYTGVATSNKTRLINKLNYTSNEPFFPTNAIFDNKWKNGKYTCVISLKASADSALLSSDTSAIRKLKNDFLRVQVNNASNCDNPLYPGSGSAACFKVLTEMKYGIEMFQQTPNYIQLTINFEVISSDPSRLKLSIPLYCTDTKSYIKAIDVESVTIERTEEYTDEFVKQKLAQAAPGNTAAPPAQ